MRVLPPGEGAPRARRFHRRAARAHYGGRWNRPGIPMVYAAQSLSLAALETVVHFTGEERGIDFLSLRDRRPRRVRGSDRAARTCRATGAPRSPSASTQDLGSALAAVAAQRGAGGALGDRAVGVLRAAQPRASRYRRVVVHFPEAFTFDVACCAALKLKHGDTEQHGEQLFGWQRCGATTNSRRFLCAAPAFQPFSLQPAV